MPDMPSPASVKNNLFTVSTEVSEEEAEQLRNPVTGMSTIQVKPPAGSSLPATVDNVVKGIYEIQTKWLKIQNESPVAALEIRRDDMDSISVQFGAPTQRLERKIRSHLQGAIPGVRFGQGQAGIPVYGGETVGGGLLTSGLADWYPLQTEFDEPPLNALVGTLHQHAMQDSSFLIQILFQPVAGHPVRRWWWRRRAYKRINYLRKEKSDLWNNRAATPREKTQADAIETKAGSPRFWVTIRFVIVGAEEYVPSRVKELAGAFNRFESTETGQYLDMKTVRSVFPHRIKQYSSEVARREFDRWTLRFQVSMQELAGLLAIPDRVQDNYQTATP